MTKPETLAELAGPLLDEARLDRELDLIFDTCRVRVRSNSAGLMADLRSYFRSFLAPEDDEPPKIRVLALEHDELEIPLELTVKTPDPGKTKIKEEFTDLPDGRLVRKRLTGMVFLFGPELNLAVGPCKANSNQVINFVNNRFIQHRLSRGDLLAHAAAVTATGAGLALAGFSGMGKSTLALALLSGGLDFVSNDRLMVGRIGGRAIMRGVAKQPRINPGTALANPDLARIVPAEDKARFEALTTDELWTLEHKYDALIEDCFGPERIRLGGNLDRLAILNWHRREEPTRIAEVDLAERLDLLAAFKKAPGLFYQPGRPVEEFTDEAYLETLAGVTVYEISGGVDFGFAADELKDRLGG